ncbi:nucleoside hydrolase-like domain-containing protein [Hyunsoonleella rubra]|uniref:Nucleoside hydrolase-like domain-containing protein n=1 Tax=Hyunsoonleella rubra TaxID=1737062 RepID=A0ABW5TGE0_9FLAO
MKSFKPILLIVFIFSSFGCTPEIEFKNVEKSRVIILADMGNEPDEVQQMLHMLICSNTFDLEGLIAVSSPFRGLNHPNPEYQTLKPELFLELIDAYEMVLPNLKLHAKGWHDPECLRNIIVVGQPDNRRIGIGDGKSTEGSNLIIEALNKDDERPIHIICNGGAGTIAQALLDYRESHTETELQSAIKKLYVFENAGQSTLGAWTCREFPEIHWVRSIYQTKAYGGPWAHDLGPHHWKPFDYTAKGQDDWANAHVRTGHGPLGELYPVRAYVNENAYFTEALPNFIEGGGTIPWMRFVSEGLTDPTKQTWGGWSGRYTLEKVENIPARFDFVAKEEARFKPWAMYTDAKDNWTDPETGKQYADKNTGIFRWRQAMWNDFKARMDWCVKSFEEANHYPKAVINGDESDAILFLESKIGETLSFDASKSADPDNDTLRFNWFMYSEAGKAPYNKVFPIENASTNKIAFDIPEDAQGKELHLILEVWDENKIVPLVDYRRVVIKVN